MRNSRFGFSKLQSVIALLIILLPINAFAYFEQISAPEFAQPNTQVSVGWNCGVQNLDVDSVDTSDGIHCELKHNGQTVAGASNSGNYQLNITLTEGANTVQAVYYIHRIGSRGISYDVYDASKVVQAKNLPNPPSGFSAQVQDQVNIDLSWNSVSTATYYQWKEQGYGSFINENSTSISLNNQLPGTYTFYLKACNQVGCSNSTSGINVTINEPQQGSDQIIPLGIYSGDTSQTAPNPESDFLDGERYWGKLEGNASVNSAGSFVYHLPLELPKAQGDVKPMLSLTYNSSSQNGLLGWGWNLGGLSSISRCKSDFARDGKSSGVMDGDDYHFCLNGTRLVKKSNTEFTLEVDNDTKIYRIGDYWIVIAPDGSGEFYGKTENSRVEGISGPIKWNIDSKSDVYGNWIEYTYDKQAHSSKISKISYTKNSQESSLPLHEIVFSYIGRPDTYGGFRSGAQYIQTERLSSVSINTNNAAKYTYKLTYQDQQEQITDPAYKSRITEINKCFVSYGIEVGCQKPLVIGWQSRELEDFNYPLYSENAVSPIAERREYLESLTPPGKKLAHYFDIDNDGEEDAFYFANNTIANHYEQRDEDGVVGNRYSTPKNNYFDIDINGDGFKDIVVLNPLITGVRVYFNVEENGARKISTDLNYSYAVSASELSFDGLRAYQKFETFGPSIEYRHFARRGKFAYDIDFVDINADGLLDLVRVPPRCAEAKYFCEFKDYSDEISSARFLGWDNDAVYPKDISVLLNTSSGWQAYNSGSPMFHEIYSNWDNEKQESLVNFSDFNRDGYPDLFASEGRLASTTPASEILMNNGAREIENMSLVEDIEYKNIESYSGDFNGDGLKDNLYLPYYKINTNSPYGSPSVEVALNNGSGFLPKSVVIESPEYLDLCGSKKIRTSFCVNVILDYNNDGLDDIVQIAGCLGNSDDLEECVAAASNAESSHMEQVWLSKGADEFGNVKFSDPIKYKSWDRYFPDKVERDRLHRFADFDGDGFLENSEFHQNNLEPNQIKSITSFGASLSIDYQVFDATALNINSGRYRGDEYLEEVALEDSDYFREDPPRQMAKRLGVNKIVYYNDESQSEVEKSESYVFIESQNDRSGFGNLGFKKIIKIEKFGASPEIRSTIQHFLTERSSDFYLAGKVARTEVYVFSYQSLQNIKISDNKVAWRVAQFEPSAYDSGPHFKVYPYMTSKETWGDDGNAISTEKTYIDEEKTKDCTPLSESIIDQVTFGAPYSDFELGNVPKYKYSILCTAEGGPDSQYVKVVKNSDVVSKQAVLGLVGRVDTFTWVGENSFGATLDEFHRRSYLYTYNDKGKVKIKTRESNVQNSFGVAETTSYFLYDVVGNMVSELKLWDDNILNDLSLGFSSGQKEIDYLYRSDGKIEVTTTTSLGTSKSIFDPTFSNILESIDENDFSTTFWYDEAGRIEKEIYNDETVKTYEYRTCEFDCFELNDSTKFYVQEKLTGASSSRVYFDAKGRTVGTRVRVLNGDFSYTANIYSASDRGKIKFQYMPQFLYEQNQKISYSYDILGRETQKHFPDGSSKSSKFEGNTVTTRNRENQYVTTTFNALGKVRQSVDDAGVQVDFDYQSSGDLISTTVNNDPDTTIEVKYDGWGRKLELHDPSAGTSFYYYNSRGELAIEYNDEYGTVNTYDEPGRLIRQSNNFQSDEVSEWHYDGVFVGKLDRFSGFDTEGNTFSEEYTYDEFARLSKKYVSSIATNLQTSYSYDDYSRPLEKVSLFSSISTIYNEFGFPYLKVDNSDGRILWQAEVSDSRGNVTQYSYGDGSTTVKSFTPETGLISQINVFRGAATLLSNEYEFDSIGNLELRIDNVNDVSQYFCYDNLNRLTSARPSSCAGANDDYQYDSLGNLIFKSEIGTLQYGRIGTGPYAVTQAGGLNYRYDDIGRLLSATNSQGVTIRSVEYASEVDKPVKFIDGSHQVDLVYDPHGNVIKRTDSNGRIEYILPGELTFIDMLGEFFIRINLAPGIDKIWPFNGDDYFEYSHFDHLGSTVLTTTDRNVQDNEQQTFGAWGERRLGDWYSPAAGPEFLNKKSTGFTGHEHMDNVGLIHMKGRVYDVDLGRFLSPDPFIQNPLNSQNYNRYTYVLNNPLSYTDPTGYITSGPSYKEEEDLQEIEKIGYPERQNREENEARYNYYLGMEVQQDFMNSMLDFNMTFINYGGEYFLAPEVELSAQEGCSGGQMCRAKRGYRLDNAGMSDAEKFALGLVPGADLVMAANDPNATSLDYLVGVLGIIPGGGKAGGLLLRSADEMADAFSHGLKYHPRIRMRGVQDPKAHNFPYSFDDVILRQSPITQADGSLLYRQSGWLNTTRGHFEIAVNPDSGVIFHRTFRASK